MKKIIAIICVFFFCSSIISGQSVRYKFKHFTSENGLVENSTNSILHDSKGFIWFATNEGLSKFDGYKFTNFISHSSDTTSLINNLIHSLFEDSKGNIWIGTDAGICIFERDKNNFLPFYPATRNNTPEVSSFAEDSDGIVYISTLNSGMYTYNPVTKVCDSFKFDPNNPASICSNRVTKIVIDNYKNIWVGTSKGLMLFNKQSKNFSYYKKPVHDSGSLMSFITSITLDSSGNLWVGSYIAVTEYNPAKNIYVDYPNKTFIKGSDALIKSNILRFVDNNTLWIGTNQGIISFNINTKQISHIMHDDNDAESLCSNEINEIFQDKEGDVFIGTRARGADKLKYLKPRFGFRHNYINDPNAQSNNEVYGMAEDKDNNIWLATLYGLNKFNPATNTFQTFLKEKFPAITNNRLWSVYTNKYVKNDLVWVGSQTGLFAVTLSGKVISNPFINKSIIDSLKSSQILCIIIDKHNNLLLGTESGLIKINLEKETFKRYTYSPNNQGGLSGTFVWRLFIDSKDNLWAATSDGLNCLKPNSDKFIIYKSEMNNPNSISNNQTMEIFEDKKGILWFGTSDGLNKFDPVANTFTHIYFSSISTDAIYSINQDDEGNLWMGIGKHLVKYSPQTGESIFYDSEDGIKTLEFNFPSLISASRDYYFAGINGVTVFKPWEITKNTHVPPVYFTKISIINKPVNVGENYNGRILLSSALENLKEITLNYDENIISFEFAALDYQAPQKNSYTYIMDNLDKNWNKAGNNRFVTYTLDPGDYVFRIQGSNNNNVWNLNGCSLIIHVLHPWWNTAWFKLLATILFFAALYFAFHLRNAYYGNQKKTLEKLVNERTSELINQQYIISEQAERIQHANYELEQLNSELEKRVIERTAELERAKERAEKADKIKSEFLAQMSHEIRSPINVILSFSALIRSEIEEIVSKDLREGFNSISNAGKRIIRTIDLLLNMSEIQTKTFEFLPERIDLLSSVIYPLLPEYSFAAKEKKLNLVLETELDTAFIVGDEYSLEQIFANLIDNAIKYTDNGVISLNLYINSDNQIICKVKDMGIGIGPEFMDKLFTPFTQEEQGYTRRYEGNGLGLALVKNYCELNDIDISVESEKGLGTTFTLLFKRTI